MALPALKSLKLTIEQLLDSSSPLPEIESLSDEVRQLQDVEVEIHELQKLSSSISEGVRYHYERQFREATHKLEDVIEQYRLSNLGLGDHQSVSPELLKQEIDSFMEKVQKLQEYMSKNLWQKDVPNVPSGIDFGRINSRMIGLEDEFVEIRDKLLNSSLTGLKTFSIVGMAGIGKSTLAKRLYEDPLIKDSFDCLSHHSLGPKCNITDVIKGNLTLNIKGLKNRRYLMVLDDAWDHHLIKMFKKVWLPDNGNGSRILLTTRLQDLASDFGGDFGVYDMRFLNEEESWSLLREKLFDDQSCPPELEKVGREIAEKCEGLPLAIITVADHLSKAEKTPKYWKKVAKNPLSICADENEPMYKALRSSYKHLPEDLKHCFLYMGVFPQSHEITASKLTKLWIAEKLVNPIDATSCLDKLVSNSLVLVCQRSFYGKTKICKLHSAFWHLCVREGGKENLFHVVDNYTDGFPQGTDNQRRLCVHNNVLFGMKHVIGSMESIPTVRSLLCTGPHHQYPVPICLGWRLLKVVEALTIRFYKFPVEVVELLLLRYLAFTYDAELPASISKLCYLQSLVVHQHLSIISQIGRSYLPMEIWDMQELRHLQVMGSDLPDPTSGAVLPNLRVILDVSACCCTEQVLKSMPNLEKLGVQIDSIDPYLNLFDRLSYLSKLRSLKCDVVTNPNSQSQVIALPVSVTMSPSSLRKLSLSGFRCPWSHMSMIGELPNLEVLKLQSYAFQGPQWITHGEHFKQLEVLLIEDTDLVHWEAKPGCFQKLKCLIIRHCYKLEEIPMEIRHPKSLQMIELVDAKTSLVYSLKKIVQLQSQVGNGSTQVCVQSSWNNQTQVMSGTLI